MLGCLVLAYGGYHDRRLKIRDLRLAYLGILKLCPCHYRFEACYLRMDLPCSGRGLG
jgi:hypothetical protein